MKKIYMVVAIILIIASIIMLMMKESKITIEDKIEILKHENVLIEIVNRNKVKVIALTNGRVYKSATFTVREINKFADAINKSKRVNIIENMLDKNNPDMNINNENNVLGDVK